MPNNHEQWSPAMRAGYHWAANQAKHLRYGWRGLRDLSAWEVANGLDTGKAAAGEALSFGLVAADDEYRHHPGFATARGLGVVGRDALLAASLEGAISLIPWQDGPISSLGETSAAGRITIKSGLEGRLLRETVRHERFHAAAIRVLPARVNSMVARWYGREGLWTGFEEVAAEFYATGRPLHSLRFVLREHYMQWPVVAAELQVLGRTVLGLGALGAVYVAGDRALADRTRTGLDWAEGWTARLHAPFACQPASSSPSVLQPGSLFSAAGPPTWPTWSLAAPRAKPMDSVRSLFASRLTDAGRGLCGTQFGIDGLAVELTEGSTTARVEDDTVLLPDAPELRGGHLSLTRAAAQVIERRVDQTLRERSVHRWFGARISAARGVGDEARLTIDGVEVVLRHGRARATVAGSDVTLSPPPRRALGAMTLAPGAQLQLDLKIGEAQRATVAQPPPPVAPWVLWSPETAAPNSVFAPRTAKAPDPASTSFVFDRLF